MNEDTNIAIYKAFRNALETVATVTKSKTVDAGNYSYSHTTLTQVLHVVKDALREQGLTLSMPLNTRDGAVYVDILLITEDGDYLHFPGYGFPVGKDPQANGSAITYAKRYSLVSMFCIDERDDDGAQASRAVTQPTKRTGAEEQIRQLFADMGDAMAREDAQAAFKAEFNSTLSALPESRHGDALAWTKAYIPNGSSE